MSDVNVPPPGMAPPPVAHAAPPPPPKSGNGLALAGFILALLALLGSWVPVLNLVAILMAVVGVILAAVGLNKAKASGSGKGLAISGLVLGALAVVLAIVVNLVFADALDEVIKDSRDTTVEKADGASSGGSGESRDDPAALGSKITGGDWAVTINSVDTTETDKYGDKAAAGQTLIVINLTATYIGDSEQGDSPWTTLKFVATDGTTIGSSDASTVFVAEQQFDSFKTVYNGASVTGNQILEVPSDTWEDGVLSVSPDLMSKDTFVALK